ncbi:hypothetical protein D3C87_1823320 [compost metagenome]
MIKALNIYRYCLRNSFTGARVLLIGSVVYNAGSVLIQRKELMIIKYAFRDLKISINEALKDCIGWIASITDTVG